MRDLNFQLKNLCLDCPEDSFSTQNDRFRSLFLVANQLHDLGFHNLSVRGLKPKHVVALVELWKKQSISVGTIKNRLACIRWWANKIGKFDMLPKDNDSYGVGQRHYVTNNSKASSLLDSDLDKISDPFIRMSLQLQAAFGLRREEALKFMPSWADKGNSIVLKGSWCKGGQQREIPITNQFQRDTLDKARKLVGFGSMIPYNRSYSQQLKLYESQCSRAGLSKMHGLRHKYAQERYFQLTSSLAPADGGITKEQVLSSSLSDTDKKSWIALDHHARLIISTELGHHRESITAVYLGR